MLTAPELEQVFMVVPAIAVAAGVIFTILEEVALPHGELPVAVKVMVTLPAAISFGPGAYNVPFNTVASSNVPSPLVLQRVPVLLVEVAPIEISAGEFEHMVTGVPALAVGCALTNTEYVAVATVHGLLETDMVKVTVLPASPAAAV